MVEPRPVAAVGKLVRDDETGRVGVLQAVDEAWTDPATPLDRRRAPQQLAFIRPVAGGREWTTRPEDITPVPTPVPGCQHPGPTKTINGVTCCAECEVQLYL